MFNWLTIATLIGGIPQATGGACIDVPVLLSLKKAPDGRTQGYSMIFLLPYEIQFI